MLDSQSDASFITDRALSCFNVPATPQNIELCTMNSSMSVSCKRVTGFQVQGHGCEKSINLPALYSRPKFPSDRSHIPSAAICNKFPHLSRVANELMPLQNVEIGLLLGYDVSYVHQPQEIVASVKESDPYAVRTPLGWCVIGSTGHTSQTNSMRSNRIMCSERTHIVYRTETTELDSKQLLNVFEQDFKDVHDVTALSKDDKRFLEITAERKQLSNKHYEIPMPCRENVIELDRNVPLAQQRLLFLKRKIERDTLYKAEYTAFMNDMISQGFCERVPVEEISNPSWYIPHHGVFHRVKKKIRVVFDCSAKYNGKSLNNCLLTGPDLINSLLGILLRFRKGHVAFQCDITKMFLQFFVSPHQRDLLRFLWWDQGDTSRPPSHFRMTRHLFGAVSSMGCANVGLQGIATDYAHLYGADAADFIRTCFYVDDGLCSVDDENRALDLIQRSIAMCKEGGVELAKFVSSSSHVMKNLVSRDPSLVSSKINIDFSAPVNERSLGVNWNVNDDSFFYSTSASRNLHASQGAFRHRKCF